MNEQKALLSAILEDPDDDTVRLVYADWLQEHETVEVCRQCVGLGGHIVPRGATHRTPANAMRRKDFKVGGRAYVARWEKCARCAGKEHASNGYAVYAAFIRRSIIGPDNPFLVLEVFGVGGAEVFEMPRGWFHCGTVNKAELAVRNDPAAKIFLTRRGFVDAIFCPAEVLFGNVCTFCDAAGMFRTSGSYAECPQCLDPRMGIGTGVTGGVLRELFSLHPITRVVVTDRRPVPFEPRYQYFNWDGLTADGWEDPYGIPRLVENAISSAEWKFPTEADAYRVLSAACVKIGRLTAGLKERKVT